MFPSRKLDLTFIQKKTFRTDSLLVIYTCHVFQSTNLIYLYYHYVGSLSGRSRDSAIFLVPGALDQKKINKKKRNVFTAVDQLEFWYFQNDGEMYAAKYHSKYNYNLC